MDGGLGEAAVGELMADFLAASEAGAGVAAADSAIPAAWGAAGAAASGTGNSASSSLVGGSYGGASAAEEEAIRQAMGAAAGESYGGGSLAEQNFLNGSLTSQNPPAPTGWDEFKRHATEGFRNVGKMYNKLPPGVSGMAMQGLLGQPQQQPQTNISPPRGGGPQQPQPSLTSMLGGQQLPKATPFAPTLGGGDDEEMRRRLLMLMQGMRG